MGPSLQERPGHSSLGFPGESMERLCREEGNPGVRGRPVPEATLLRVTEFKNVVKEEKAISQNKRYRSLYQGEAVPLEGTANL